MLAEYVSNSFSEVPHDDYPLYAVVEVPPE
jgi:hypothetical protein